MNDPAESGQRDAGPKWQQLSLLSNVFRGSQTKRTPPRHEGNGKNITSVSPSFPPRVAGLTGGIKGERLNPVGKRPCIAIGVEKDFKQRRLVAGLPLGKTFLLFLSNRAQSVGIFSPDEDQNVSRFDL